MFIIVLGILFIIFALINFFWGKPEEDSEEYKTFEKFAPILAVTSLVFFYFAIHDLTGITSFPILDAIVSVFECIAAPICVYIGFSSLDSIPRNKNFGFILLALVNGLIWLVSFGITLMTFFPDILYVT